MLSVKMELSQAYSWALHTPEAHGKIGLAWPRVSQRDCKPNRTASAAIWTGVYKDAYFAFAFPVLEIFDMATTTVINVLTGLD